MSHQDDPLIPTLDDPTLKVAARHAWGNGMASQDLRRRVLMAMTRTVLEEPDIPESTRSPQFWDRWPKPARIGASVAALLVLSVGLTWGLMAYSDRPNYARVQKTYTAPPAQPTLYALLVARHDDFAAGSEAATQPGEDAPPAPDRIAAVRDTLANQFKHAVWVPDLVKLGWRLAAVRAYSINGVTAVAFNFRRGSDHITAFSLPVTGAGDECAGGMSELDLLIGNRSVAGFGNGGQLFALVGSRDSSPLPQPELRALMAQFREDPNCHAACITMP